MHLRPKILFPLISNLRRFFGGGLVILWLSLGIAPAMAGGHDDAGLSAVGTENAQALIETLRDPDARDALISQLEGLLALRAGEASEPETGEPALAAISAKLGEVARGLAGLGTNVGDPARIVDWVDAQFQDPDRAAFWGALLLDLVIMLVVSLVLMAIGRALLRKPRRFIEGREAPTLWVRVPLLGLRTRIVLVPLAVFGGAAFAVIAVLAPDASARGVLVAVISAIAFARGLATIARAVLTPLAPNLRLLPIADQTAAYLFVWFRRLVNLGVYGYLVAQIALLFGMPEAGYAVITKAVGLLELGLMLTFVTQNRVGVRDWLSGGDADSESAGTFDVVRARLGDVWHILASLYLVAVFIVWALEVAGGFELIAQGSIATIVILLVARGLIEVVRRLVRRLFRISSEMQARFPALEARADRYLWIVHRVVTAVIYLIAAFAILEAWDIDAFAFFETTFGALILSRAFSILIIVLMALLIWESANAVIDRLLNGGDSDGGTIVQSARIRTLLPLARSVVLSLVVVIAALAILSELGVNIAPLLAGAGVIGLAVGFGAQTLVKDIITGAFILFEDTIAVGDYIEVAGCEGTIEALTVRTIKLRDVRGTVHTIPFSSVETVTNYTKDYAYHLAEIGVAYRENTDDVAKVLREIGEELRADPKFSNDIIAPTEIMGLDRFEDSAVVIRARLKTKPGKQWRIKREYNRRVKLRFDELGIEIPFPHTTIFFGEDKEGAAPAAHVVVETPPQGK